MRIVVQRVLQAAVDIAGQRKSEIGQGLLILVGVILDTLQQIESYLLMRHYDGLMKTGRLTGRSGM